MPTGQSCAIDLTSRKARLKMSYESRLARTGRSGRYSAGPILILKSSRSGSSERPMSPQQDACRVVDHAHFVMHELLIWTRAMSHTRLAESGVYIVTQWTASALTNWEGDGTLFIHRCIRYCSSNIGRSSIQTARLQVFQSLTVAVTPKLTRRVNGTQIVEQTCLNTKGRNLCRTPCA